MRASNEISTVSAIAKSIFRGARKLHELNCNDGEQFINKNYAAIFPWIDRLFGTLYLPKHRWPQKYGIGTTSSPNFLGQILDPLEPNRAKI